MTTHSSDRRAERTRARLHQALASLIHEKPYGGVVVKEILARADVGRSTFYSHFRNKEELLESSIRDVLEPGNRDLSVAEEMLQSARRMFEHIDQQLAAEKRLDAPGQTHVHERLRAMLVGRVADRLNTAAVDQRSGRPDLPDDLIAQFVASTFVVLLEWWLNGNTAIGAAELSKIMERLIAPICSR